MSPRLIIEQLARTRFDGVYEKLEFTEGVNAIVGPQNAGKSTWLRMLDYIMGDDSSPNLKFDDTVVRKYRSINALMRIGGVTIELERSWKDEGTRSQTFLNGDRIRVDEVQLLFLKLLEIPLLRFPQGNIFTSDRTWPTLGWRSLLRHVYRRQDHWSDLIPQQPESEQHACILQFLGLAEYLFSSDLSELTDKRKRLANLSARQGYFTEILQKLVPSLMDDEDLAQEVSIQSIKRAIDRIDGSIGGLVAERSQLVAGLREKSHMPMDRLNGVLEERAAALARRDVGNREIVQTEARINELKRYQSNLARELVRLDRTDAASSILEDLRVTHCPACDQSVDVRPRHADSCFLCGQVTLETELTKDAAARRLKFERDQITAELVEAGDLISVTESELQAKTVAAAENDQRLEEIGQALRPFQASISAIVPEEIALIDQQIGALNARKQTIDALRGPIEASADLDDEMLVLKDQIAELEDSVAKREENVNFELANKRIGEGFNSYLNSIRNADSATWTKTGDVSASISERRTQLSIAGRPAKPQLGGTLTIYFLFAYHFALLNLSRYKDCHYPGLTVLDFYPDIAKETALSDRLHLVLAPFVRLSQDSTIEPIQVITTSRALPKRPHINYINLTEVWR